MRNSAACSTLCACSIMYLSVSDIHTHAHVYSQTACRLSAVPPQIMNLSPTPEPQHPTADRGASAAGVAGHLTPDLTITGTGIKPLPYDSRVAAAAGSASGSPAGAAASRSAQASKKPWGARSVPGSSNGGSDANNATTPPRRSSSSSGGGAARKPGSAATTQPSAGVPASLLKPTAASVARAQATSRPRHEESVWKH